MSDIHELSGISEPSDIEALKSQLEAAEQDAQALVADLTEELGGWHIKADSWSVAQCLDHLASTNRAYLGAMKQPAMHAQDQGRIRRGPAAPGLVGRWFVGKMEPPVNAAFKIKSPRSVEPRHAPPLSDAFASFTASQDDVRAFLSAYADLDLAAIRFQNPFVSAIRFSLATGLHVITAHERRHLWQAWRVRRAAEGAAS